MDLRTRIGGGPSALVMSGLPATSALMSTNSDSSDGFVQGPATDLPGKVRQLFREFPRKGLRAVGEFEATQSQRLTVLGLATLACLAAGKAAVKGEEIKEMLAEIDKRAQLNNGRDAGEAHSVLFWAIQKNPELAIRLCKQFSPVPARALVACAYFNKLGVLDEILRKLELHPSAAAVVFNELCISAIEAGDGALLTQLLNKATEHQANLDYVNLLRRAKQERQFECAKIILESLSSEQIKMIQHNISMTKQLGEKAELPWMEERLKKSDGKDLANEPLRNVLNLLIRACKDDASAELSPVVEALKRLLGDAKHPKVWVKDAVATARTYAARSGSAATVAAVMGLPPAWGKPDGLSLATIATQRGGDPVVEPKTAFFNALTRSVTPPPAPRTSRPKRAAEAGLEAPCCKGGRAASQPQPVEWGIDEEETLRQHAVWILATMARSAPNGKIEPSANQGSPAYMAGLPAAGSGETGPEHPEPVTGYPLGIPPSRPAHGGVSSLARGTGRLASLPFVLKRKILVPPPNGTGA